MTEPRVGSPTTNWKPDRLTASRGWRALVLIVALLLLIWLAVERPSRKRAISDLVDQGRFGQLDADELSNLEERLRALATLAGCQSEIVFHQVPNQDKLNVYFAESSTSSITGCAAGNAIYDAGLDAIFIDRMILKPLRASGTFGSMRIEDEAKLDRASYVYLDFIFLHELGHRVLHRNQKSLFDMKVNAIGVDTTETEADEFALRLLMDSPLKYDDVGLQSQHRFSRRLVDSSFDDERVKAAIAEMGLELGRAVVFGNTGFSYLGIGSSHPPFFKRCLTMVEAALSDTSSRTLGVLLTLARNTLRSLTLARSAVVTELILQDPIERLKFDNGRILAICRRDDATWAIYHEAISSTSSMPQLLDLTSQLEFETDAMPKAAVMSGTLAWDKSGVAHLLAPGYGQFILSESAHAQDVTLCASKRCIQDWEAMFISPGSEVIVAMDRPDELVYHVFVDWCHTITMTRDNIETSLVAAGMPEGSRWGFERPTSTRVIVSFQPRSQSAQARAGIVILDPMSLSVLSVHSSQLGSAAAFPGTLAFTGSVNEPSLWWVGDTLDVYSTKSSPFQLHIYALEDDEARLAASVPLLLDAIPIGDNLNDWMGSQHPTLVSVDRAHGGLVCRVWLDSLFYFSEANESLQSFYYPPEIATSGGEQDLLALFGRGGSRCFLLNLESMDRSRD